MADLATKPAPPRNEDELDDLLAAPTAETVEAAARLDGDLLVLGAGGKMGPSLAALARRSIDAAGVRYRVICVSRFSAEGVRERLSAAGVETIACDLLEREELARLPDAPNVLFLAGMKFGTSGAPEQTWALNSYLPAIVAERYRDSRIVALSTGNVYPLVSVSSGGATESTPTGPVGEYAESCLGRERMFQYMASKHGQRSLLIRLNYATDLRYGVLLDVALKVHRGEPVDVSMSWVNSIWQGDANAILLRAFPLCASPPDVLNVTGSEIISVRQAAERFAELLEAPAPTFAGTQSDLALLSDASRCHSLFGLPRITAETLIEWTADWVRRGGPTLGKPTHFETRDGTF